MLPPSALIKLMKSSPTPAPRQKDFRDIVLGAVDGVDADGGGPSCLMLAKPLTSLSPPPSPTWLARMSATSWSKIQGNVTCVLPPVRLNVPSFLPVILAAKMLLNLEVALRPPLL